MKALKDIQHTVPYCHSFNYWKGPGPLFEQTWKPSSKERFVSMEKKIKQYFKTTTMTATDNGHTLIRGPSMV